MAITRQRGQVWSLFMTIYQLRNFVLQEMEADGGSVENNGEKINVNV